jgi:hypothetical protein
MNRLRPLERCNRGFVSHSTHLFCVYVVLCVRSGLAKGWSPIQGVLPTVYRIKKLKKRPTSKGLYSHRGEKSKKMVVVIPQDFTGLRRSRCFIVYVDSTLESLHSVYVCYGVIFRMDMLPPSSRCTSVEYVSFSIYRGHRCNRVTKTLKPVK